MAAVGVRRALPHPVDDRVVAALDAVPAPVAVHRVVAAADRRDPGVGMGHGEAPLEVRRRGRGPTAARVSRPSSSAWTRTAGTPCARRQLDEGDEVTVVGVDAARPDEADEVQASVGRRRASAGLEQRRLREERAVRDRGVDARQVLEDGPAGAEVQVPHLRVAHLAGRQADRILRRAAGSSAASDSSSPRQTGIRACAIASAAGSRPMPKPSRTTRTIGRGRSPVTAARAAGRCRESGPRHDAGHLVRLERRATDERAVDRGLGQELGDRWPR